MKLTIYKMRKTLSKRINTWYEQYKTPPVDVIKSNWDHYAGLWINPWYRFPRRNLPLPVFQEMLDKFSMMYDDWDSAFKDAGNPYDLQLWIYDEHMIDSQLLCAGVEKDGEQRNNYFNACPEQYKFQSEKYTKSTYFDPDDFKWMTYEVRSTLYEKSDELTPHRIRKLLKQGWKKDIVFPGTMQEENSFWMIYDFVWVGRKL